VRAVLAIAVVLAVMLAFGGRAQALNKQGAREAGASDAAQSLSGYVFFGGFLYNPTYAARPGNSGLALLRAGLHVDADVYRRWLTLSYDLNMFTDGSGDAPNPAPSEHDHIVGVLTTIPLPRDFSLTFAVHYENDSPGVEARPAARGPDYQLGYSQSYVDAYARATWERGRFMAAIALGGFLWNPTYAARPDNSGIALLRYVAHGEVKARDWLTLRGDFNFFTDRDDGPLTPSEADVTAEVGAHAGAWELRLVGEVDVPITSPSAAEASQARPHPGFTQYYVALLLQWNFAWKRR
jgi:hypothetical protein